HPLNLRSYPQVFLRWDAFDAHHLSGRILNPRSRLKRDLPHVECQCSQSSLLSLVVVPVAVVGFVVCGLRFGRCPLLGSSVQNALHLVIGVPNTCQGLRSGEQSSSVEFHRCVRFLSDRAGRSVSPLNTHIHTKRVHTVTYRCHEPCDVFPGASKLSLPCLCSCRQ